MRWEVPFVHKKSHLFSSLICASQVIKEVQDFYRDTYNKLKGKDDPQRETLKAIHYAVRWPHKDATLLSSPCFRTCVYPFQSSWGGWFFGVFVFLFFFFFLFRATPAAYGDSQARGQIAARAATATPDPSYICSLHHSSWQHRIPEPLSKGQGLNPHPHG